LKGGEIHELLVFWCHNIRQNGNQLKDTRPNDAEQKGIQHNNTQQTILHKTVKNVMLSIVLLVFRPGVIWVNVVVPFFETREKGFA
jgi:hypothetical protein